MITLVASTRRATAVSDDAITTRSVGIPVTLDLSEHFDGLSVTLVCKAGEVKRDVAVLDPDALQVPVECLQVAGVPLLLGLYASNAAGTKVIPTIWASAGTIRVGTEQSEVSPSDPTPDWTAQVQQWAEDAHNTAERLAAEVDGWENDIETAVAGAERVDATASKSGTTATITLTDRTGAEHAVTVSDGAQGEAGQDGYSPSAKVMQGDGSATITIIDKDGTTIAAVHDGADGRDGRDGTDGVDGYSPTATVTQTASGATISITDKSGTTTASVSNGTDGTDGTDGADGFSPTVDVQPITGGHEVTITDADGPHSFDVMDGDPAEPGSITDELLAPDGIKPQVAQLWGNQLTGTMSGTIDTADDAYAAPPMALSVEGASTQAGTPTPDAPVPILSVDELALNVAGKNLLNYNGADSQTINGVTFTKHADGKWTANGTATATTALIIGSIDLIADRSYVISGCPASGGTTSYELMVTINATGGSGWYHDYGTGRSFSDSAPATRGVQLVVRNGYTANNLVFAPMVELGTSPTSYVPYAEIPTVPLYDGTLRSLPDGTKDTLSLSYLRPSTREGWAWYSRKVTRAVGHVADMGELAWNTFTYSGTLLMYANIADMIEAQSGITTFLCSGYVAQASKTINELVSMPDLNCAPKNTYKQVYVKDSNYTDAGAFKAAVEGMTLLYPLATPVTTQLDPIELPTLPSPNATVWCDGGSAQPTYSMQYVQDTNIVIADMRAALADLATS